MTRRSGTSECDFQGQGQVVNIIDGLSRSETHTECYSKGQCQGQGEVANIIVNVIVKAMDTYYVIVKVSVKVREKY